MKEIVKHINDTNASYRTLGAGDAKNTDLFLDNEHFDLFKDSGEQITVRFDKENLSKAILFIASILPRKYDCSTTHTVVNYSVDFVLEQLAILDGFFMVDGKPVNKRTQVWNARKDVEKKNGEIDSRFYFNGLICDVFYNYKGMQKQGKFTLRNYLAGAYSDIKITKADDGIFDIVVTNAMTPNNEGIQENIYHEDLSDNQPLQQIFYGAPGTGKSHEIQERTKGCDVIRTTFHPDSDYASFVGAYKPTMEHLPLTDEKGQTIQVANTILYKDQITYSFVKQAFLQAYLSAWKKYQENPDNPKKQYLIVEEINRGNCAQIFGDLFQLLDRQDNGFSTYPIQADGDMKKAIQKAFAQETDYKLNATLNVEGVVENYKSFSRKTLSEDIVNGDVLLLPSNLCIWATMNTSDQSLFPIDSAFKRRWEWKYMKIADMEKGYKIEVNGKHYDWWKFIDKMNGIIGAATSSEDKKLGYFFCKVKEGTTDITAEQFVSKVLFYIYGDALKDYDIKDDSFKKEEKDGKKIYYSFSDFYDAKGDVDKEMVAKLLNTFVGADENAAE